VVAGEGRDRRRLVPLRVLEMRVRRDHPLGEGEWRLVRRAARRGEAVPEPLRPAARAEAEALLASSDLGLAPAWLIYGFLVLAALNLLRWLGNHEAAWALPMTILYAAIALSIWRIRDARGRGAEQALAVNTDPG